MEKLQSEIFQIAKKTGISSAAKLALIAPKTPAMEDHVPDCEWWDSVIMTGDKFSLDATPTLKDEAISNLVEHPTQMRPPSKCYCF